MTKRKVSRCTECGTKLIEMIKYELTDYTYKHYLCTECKSKIVVLTVKKEVLDKMVQSK